jgi:parvulin-like peptidyl-prolyl isomerase
MLQRLRDYFPRWLMTVLLGILGIAMAFLGVYSPQGEESKAPHAAILKVNGKTIRRTMVDHVYERLKQQEQHQLGANFKMTASLELQLRQRALMQLVTTEVLKQTLYTQGYRIHSDGILKALKQIPVFQINKQFSSDRFEEVITGLGYTRSSFLATLKHELLIHQLSQGLLKTAFILPSELDHAIRLLKQKRDFDYIEILPHYFKKPAHLISDEQMQHYYDHHLSELRIPEQVSIDYVVIALSDLHKKLQRKNPNQARVQLRVETEKEFLNAIDTLTHLSYAHPTSLTEVAQSLEVPIQSTGLFSRAGGDTVITRHPDVIDAAFSAEVLKGYNSAVLSLSSDQVIVLRVKQHQPVRLPAFEEVKAVIQERLRTEQAQQAAKAYGEQLVKELQKKDVTVTLPEHLRWVSVKHATRYGKQAPPTILNAAFKIPRQENETHTIGLALPQGHYVIIRLLKVQEGRLDQLTTQQKKLYQEALTAEKGQFEYEEYVRNHVQHAKISHQFNP